jgi:crotonobetainyl-CoA:carnitine CoA-transferase CaiB-like acyl-CoA transferase
MLLLTGNRNKRSLALDLKKPEAVAVARKLIATSDVIAENFRPGVLDKLGLGYEDARKIKPDIIFAAASGFGADGPYVNRPGQDLLIQALSGLAMITGSRTHGPRAVGVSAIDHHGAALFAAGILAALVKKERTGQGCRVDVSLLSAALDLQMESFTCYLNGQAQSRDGTTARHTAFMQRGTDISRSRLDRSTCWRIRWDFPLISAFRMRRRISDAMKRRPRLPPTLPCARLRKRLRCSKRAEFGTPVSTTMPMSSPTPRLFTTRVFRS